MRTYEFNSSGQIVPRPETGTVQADNTTKTAAAPSRPTLTAADAAGTGSLVWQVLNDTNNAYLYVYDASMLRKPLFKASLCCGAWMPRRAARRGTRVGRAPCHGLRAQQP